jgi:hypothetical protein
MLLVITYSRAARRTLRNVCRAHEELVIRRFGRAALFAATGLGAFQALRLREKYGVDVQIERVEPFVASDVPESVRDAAAAYEGRENPSLPYRQFAAGTRYPAPATLREQDV